MRSYRNAIALLLRFVRTAPARQPSALDWEDLGAETISAFLDHLEADRAQRRPQPQRPPGGGAVAVPLCRSASPRACAADRPGSGHSRRSARDKRQVSFLEPDEVDALLAAPDQGRWEGRRDHALIALAVQTGLRLSELIGLSCA